MAGRERIVFPPKIEGERQRQRGREREREAERERERECERETHTKRERHKEGDWERVCVTGEGIIIIISYLISKRFQLVIKKFW